MRLQFLAIPLLVALMLSPLAAAAATGAITFSSPTSGAQISGTAAIRSRNNLANPITSRQRLHRRHQSIRHTSRLASRGGPSGRKLDPLRHERRRRQPQLGLRNIHDCDKRLHRSDWKHNLHVHSLHHSSVRHYPHNSGKLQLYRPDRPGCADYALAYWNNGSAAKAAVWTATVYGPTGSAAGITWTKSSPASGVALWTATIPAGAADGVYAAEISATEGGITSWTQTSFQVNSGLASTSSIASLATA